MKILSLFFILLSTQALAFDWQYSIKYPDGKIVTKEVLNKDDGFIFQIGDSLCGVNEPDSADEDEDIDYYDVNCLNEKGGDLMTMSALKENDEYKTHFFQYIEKGKIVKIEIVLFNYYSKKTRKPFST